LLNDVILLASVVESVSLPGVTEAFNQTLASYSNMADADPTSLLKMTQFISYSQKPSAVLIDALPTVVPIVLNVIREDVALGMGTSTSIVSAVFPI
jgi:recombinational DNA repair protein RecT